MLLWPFRKKKYYNYNEVWSIIEKKYFEGFLYFNNSNEATKYFEKYKDIPFSEKLQYALVCYSGDNCEAVNDYLKNRFEGESPEQYDNRKHQWKASIIHTCKMINTLYGRYIQRSIENDRYFEKSRQFCRNIAHFCTLGCFM